MTKGHPVRGHQSTRPIGERSNVIVQISSLINTLGVAQTYVPLLPKSGFFSIMRALHLVAATAIFSIATAHFELGKRADFGIDWNEEDFSSESVFQDAEPAIFLDAIQGSEKNVTLSQLQDRSTELYERQQCQAGYGYCAAFGRCCPSSNKCCGYGYCLEPGKTCCPNGPCDAGLTCCENKCIPNGAQCCRGGAYCEAGNMCVLYNGRGVCCTDLQCTAVVRGGTTSFATTTTPAPAAPPPPTITQPPRTTQVIVDSFTTYYWTVRWRYFSYYWTIFQARSTVTYTTITFTTIYTTTATDDRAASAIFAELSKTLTFSTPAEATTLASLLDAAPSPTATPTTALETELGSSEAPEPTSQNILLPPPSDDKTTSGPSVTRASTSRTSSSRTASSSSAPSTISGSASAAGAMAVQTTFVVLAALSGVVMIWL
ncbi:hypothetical protein BU25DRAFT_256610 [Macroventuria anomochaeta]|uniref:Uncharacterized protein n=1 Tax=Macroventuria anomochaeta TaxID=301207 RepID=A0ACB6S9U6_9PLEO|nr:uncharacterized protein BU25DRAFT_256610 [Macroventuria anomochaeta]KAF2630355.1 hypothetical protein BU25DRAFT_256610 [Macroventuria anomochaeta]